MTLLASLIIRTVLIIAITDAVVFFVIAKRKTAITIPLVISIILVTLVPLLINIWAALNKFGIK